MEINYIRGVYGVKMGWRKQWQHVSDLISMGITARLDYGVVEWVKCGALRWFGHVMRMSDNDCEESV